LTFTGTNPGNFSTTSTNCPSSIPAGTNCQVTIQFSPIALTSYSANLTETDVPDSISLNLPLTGSGVSNTIISAPCPWCVE
jgi:hypothetical protein